MTTTKLSVADVAAELDQRIEKMEHELQGMRRLGGELRQMADAEWANEVIAGVMEDNNDDVRPVSVARLATAAEEKKEPGQEAQVTLVAPPSPETENVAVPSVPSVPETVATVVAGQRRGEEKAKEKITPLEAACREISTRDEGSSRPIFPEVATCLRQVGQLVADKDIEQLTGLMAGVSEMFGIYHRTRTNMSGTTRRELMDRVRDVVYMLIGEYAGLMEQGRRKEASAIRKAMTMTGIVRLERMIMEKDLPPAVVSRMERLGCSIVGENKATQLLDALECDEEESAEESGGQDGEQEQETVEKLLGYAQKIEEAQEETKQAGIRYGLARQGCVNRSRALVREAKETEFTSADMKLIERLVTEDRLPAEVANLMDEEAAGAIVKAEAGRKAKTLLYSLVGTVFRLNPRNGSGAEKAAITDEVAISAEVKEATVEKQEGAAARPTETADALEKRFKAAVNTENFGAAHSALEKMQLLYGPQKELEDELRFMEVLKVMEEKRKGKMRKDSHENLESGEGKKPTKLSKAERKAQRRSR